jgi:hypothetical protein
LIREPLSERQLVEISPAGEDIRSVARQSRRSIVVNNLKRFTVCKVAGHKWAKVTYPRGADGETGGHFLRCLRCGKENHEAGTVARGAGPVL